MHIDRRRAHCFWNPEAILIPSLLLAASFAAPSWAQENSAPAQAFPEPSEVEALKERMKALEQTVEDLKKERRSLWERDGPVSANEALQRLTSGTGTTVREHHRESGFLRQDSYADPRLDNAPFDPKLRGFFLIPWTQSMFRLGGDSIRQRTGRMQTHSD